MPRQRRLARRPVLVLAPATTQLLLLPRFAIGLSHSRPTGQLSRRRFCAVVGTLGSASPPPDGDGGPNHWECWLHDLDGYTVVLASPDGSAG